LGGGGLVFGYQANAFVVRRELHVPLGHADFQRTEARVRRGLRFDQASAGLLVDRQDREGPIVDGPFADVGAGGERQNRRVAEVLQDQVLAGGLLLPEERSGAAVEGRDRA